MELRTNVRPVSSRSIDNFDLFLVVSLSFQLTDRCQRHLQAHALSSMTNQSQYSGRRMGYLERLLFDSVSLHLVDHIINVR